MHTSISSGNELAHLQTATSISPEVNGSIAWSAMAKEVLAYTWLRGNYPFCSCFGKGLGTDEGKALFFQCFLIG